MTELKIIDRKTANELLSGAAIIPGMEEMVLKSMGYKIQESSLPLKKLIAHKEGPYNYTIDDIAQTQTQNYVVAAGTIMRRYYGNFVEKDRELCLEYASKNNMHETKVQMLGNFPVSTRTSFYAEPCSIIKARIEHLGADKIRADFLDPNDIVKRSYTVDLANQK